MAVVWKPLESTGDPDHVAAELTFIYEPMERAGCCFYCSEELAFPAVYWAGYGERKSPSHGYIFLHYQCAAELGAKLAMDGLKAQQGKRGEDA